MNIAQAFDNANEKYNTAHPVVVHTVALKPIEDIKKGDYFRMQGQKKVYIQKGYCRHNKKYEGQSFDDINVFKYLKKGTMVEADFDF